MTNVTDGLLSSLWRSSWQGTLALLFVWVLCRLSAGRLTANVHCWLWRLSYIKLLAGLVWAGAVVVPLLSPAPPSPPMAQPQAAFTPQATQETERAAIGTEISPTAPAQAKAKPRLTWQMGLAAAYLLGVAVCLGRLLMAARRTRRVLRAAVPVLSRPETDCAVHLAQEMRLRRVPLIAHSPAVDGPVLMAGRVLFPAEARYSDAELKMILAHELAHARRRDLAWEWLGTLVQAAFFFHPLVVLARREERLAREAAADALALETSQAAAADYGKLLLSLALEQIPHRPMLLGAVGAIEGGPLLRRRLLALRNAASGCRDRRTGWRVATALALPMALVFVPWQLTRGRAQTPAAVSAPTPAAFDVPTLPVGNKQITGVIYNERKKPVAGLNVRLGWHWSQRQKSGGTMTGTRIVGSVVTNAQGRFTFPHLPAGNFYYGVYSPTDQYVPVQATLRLGKIETQKALHLVILTGALVTGRVVGEQTGKPIQGVFVSAGLIPPGGDLSKWEFWTMPFLERTDAEGRYQIRVVPGNVFVGVGQSDGGTTSNRRVRPTVRRVTVRAGQTASAPDISVLLNPAIVFVGPDGEPVADTPVRITAADMTKDILDDRTNAAGVVVLGRGRAALGKSGTFSIAQGERIAYGTFHWSLNGLLVINMDGQTLTYPSGIGTVHLTEGSAALVTGRVVSEDGKPIPNALIRIVETDSKSGYVLEDQTLKTDAAGVFRAPLDPNGQYHAYVRADGFNQVSVSDKPLSVAKGRTTDFGPIHLVSADGFVSGRVVNRSGKPMAGVLASVNGAKTLVSAAVTDSRGEFRIPNVVPGESLRLELALKGEASDSGTALRQSNEMMEIPGVKASSIERQIIWNPHSR